MYSMMCVWVCVLHTACVSRLDMVMGLVVLVVLSWAWGGGMMVVGAIGRHDGCDMCVCVCVCACVCTHE